MRFVIITDAFPPMCNSGAVQIRDLAREFIRQNHDVTVLLPSSEINDNWSMECADGIEVLRLKTFKTKDVGYIRRALSEFAMPFIMLWRLNKSPLKAFDWDGVIWYSPSIFHGFLAKRIKTSCNCKAYLIIRDIFPQWALDMGLMSRGLPYLFLDMVARYQYSVADIIGVQSPGNVEYFNKLKCNTGARIHVLQNWLGATNPVRCALRVSETHLSGRKIFVYAGNMGVAQALYIFIELAAALNNNNEIGFLFVGRGSEVDRLKKEAILKNLSNILFADEIHPDQISDLYSQCNFGIVALDPRHKSHNIPGKFLTYIQNGLPVLANLNYGNDLAELIRRERIGAVCETHDVNILNQQVHSLMKQASSDFSINERCRDLFKREFSVHQTVSQIVNELQ